MSQAPVRHGVFVLGVFVADLAFRAARMPVIGETILGRGFASGPGGKGSNQAIAAARAGGKVVFLTRIGADGFGDMARKAWSEAGVAQDAISVDPAAPTGVAFIFVSTESGDNAIIIESGAAGNMTVAHVAEAEPLIARASVFVTQLEQPIEVALAGLRLARKHGVTTVLNPAPAAELPAEMFALCDYITPNETEAALLAGIPVDDDEGAAAAARALLERGVGNVVMTLGERGALLLNAARSQFFVAMRDAKVVDTTGAGDAFNGGFVAALAQGSNVDEAIRFANVVAGLSVGRAGTAPSMPTRTEIDDALLRQAG